MCAQFQIKTSFRELAEKYGLTLPPEFEEEWIDERILPYRAAPVIIQKKNKTEIHMMNFSLVPSWSKEKKVKFATHNARLQTEDDKTGKTTFIYEKPTWRAPFKSSRCLVPISSFVEPIYEGKLANNMVSFSSTDKEILTAAGLWSEWTDQETGEVLESFAIVTGEPSDFVLKTGHDRQPIFLKPKAFEQWLDPKFTDNEKLVKLLLDEHAEPKFEAKIDRPIKKKSK